MTKLMIILALLLFQGCGPDKYGPDKSEPALNARLVDKMQEATASIEAMCKLTSRVGALADASPRPLIILCGASDGTPRPGRRPRKARQKARPRPEPGKVLEAIDAIPGDTIGFAVGLYVYVDQKMIDQWARQVRLLPPGTQVSQVVVKFGDKEVSMSFDEFLTRLGLKDAAIQDR